MKYVDLNDVEGEINPGTAVCGIGFKSVTVTHDDVKDYDYFMKWFTETILHRLCPTSEPA